MSPNVPDKNEVRVSRTRRASTATLFVAVVWGSTAFAQPDRPKGRTDADDPPLPEGAIARLGSARFRFDGSFMGTIVFSPDGRQVAAAGHRTVSVFDTVTGRALRVLALPDEHHARAVRFLAGGKRLAVGSSDWRQAAELNTYNLTDGRVVSTSKFTGKDQIFVFDVTPDGSRALVVDWSVKAFLWDVAARREVWAIEHKEGTVILPFTADGKRFVVAGDKKAELHETKSGKAVASFSSVDPRFANLYEGKLSPDGRLAIGSNEGDTIAVLAAEGDNRLRMFPSDRRVERLFFSPDSRFLVGPSEFGTQVWDQAAAGDKGPVARLPAASGAGLSADGKTLALSDDGYLTLWSVGDWIRLPQSADPPSAVMRVRFTPDGKHVIGYTRGGWVRWQAGGGPATRLSDDSPVHHEGMADVSEDGRVGLDVLHEPAMNARADDEGKYALRVTDLATGKDRRIPLDREPGYPVQLSPDGRHVLAYLRGSQIVVWEAESGAVLHRFKNPAKSTVFGAAATADGKELARSAIGAFTESTGFDLSKPAYTSVTVTDHPGGRQWKMEPMPWGVYTGGGRFSSDGSRLVVQGRWDSDWTKNSVTVWDVGSGRRLMSWDCEPGRVASVALSPDNRSLLAGDANGRLVLIEVASGGERITFKHGGNVLSAAFHPDGTKAISSSPDGPVYVWDLLGNPGPWDAAKADAVWADLVSGDAKVAFAAIRKLRANPAAAVVFLRDRVKVPAPPAEAAVAALLKRLDSPRFADRERAQKELIVIADLIRPRLEAARKAASEEAGRRLDQVLKAAENLTPEGLRHVRVCELLEGIRTPEATRLLRSFAGGPGGARLTIEAKESLARLGP